MIIKKGHPQNSAGINQTRVWHKFTLKEDNEFQGQFNQASLTILPAYLNETPIEIAVDHILKISRVDNSGWIISQKLKHFVFELTNGMKIAGIPIEKECLVTIPVIGPCQFEFENVVTVERVV